MSRPVKIGIFLAGVFALVAVAWVVFLPAVVEHELRSITGFEFRVEVLSANPFTGRVVVRGLAATNPSDYPKPDFVALRQLHAEVRVFSWLFRGHYVVENLDLEIGRIVLIRRHDGMTNAIEFWSAFAGHRPVAASPPAPSRFLVKHLHLILDQLVVADYSGSKPDEKTYDLHIDQTYLNVTDSHQLLFPDVIKSLHSFGLHHDIARLLPGDFGQALALAVGGAARLTGAVKDAVIKTGENIKGTVEKLETSPKQ